MITKEEVLKALNVIEGYKEQQQKIIKGLEAESDNRSLIMLGLNTRELCCLKAADITTIGELLAFDRYDLIKLRNLGIKSVNNINRKIKEFGIETEEFRNKY